MSEEQKEFTIGVEEEYQIIHPATRELRSRSERILPEAESAVGDNVQPELYRSQIEIGTAVCRTLGDARAELVRLRREVIRAAAHDGSRIAAAGTHPFSHWEDQQLTPKERYLELAQDYRQLAREQLIFGCHVHVGMSDREAAIEVMNRVCQWLPPLLALSANSPFWLRADTGYASFRTEIWRRWPLADLPLPFASRAEYDALVDVLVASDSVSDGTKIYWDVRPSARFETLEFRVTDVCLTIDEAVMTAGLVQALVSECYRRARRGEGFSPLRPELLRAAKWRAARSALDAELIDLSELRAVPARQVVDKLMVFVRPSLTDLGTRDEVERIVGATIANGNGAARQRAVYQETENLEAVVDYVVKETARGVEEEGG